MINDRSNGGVGPDVNFDGVTYWVSDKQPLTDINNWRKVTPSNFQKSSPTDNVWDVDCSSFFPPAVGGAGIHGAYFVNDGTINLMRHVLRGLDRGVLYSLGYIKGTAWP